MSYRYMRVLLFFDLPVDTAKNRRDYRKFRKFLIDEGFIMMQESVYAKLALNNSVVNSVKLKVNNNKPPKGLVQMLVVTEKQFNSIEIIVGESKLDILDSTERLVVL